MANSWQIRHLRGSYGGLTGSTRRFLPRKISPIYCRVSYVAVTRIPSLALRITWHYVIIRYSYGELPKFVLRCSIRGGFTQSCDHGISISIVSYFASSTKDMSLFIHNFSTGTHTHKVRTKKRWFLIMITTRSTCHVPEYFVYYHVKRLRNQLRILRLPVYFYWT